MERLLLIMAGVLSVDAASRTFIGDPVRALLGIPGANIKRIILVEPRDDDGDANKIEDLTTLDPQPGATDDDYPLSKDTRIVGKITSVTTAQNLSGGLTRVLMISPESFILHGHAVEFKPYNDAELPMVKKKITTQFVNDASNFLQKLFDVSNPLSSIELDLAKLKAHYHGVFTYGYARNAISLFLFIGTTPITKKRLRLRVETHIFIEGLECDHLPKRNGFLYCGDGSLSSNPRVVRLKNHLKGRLDDGLVGMQVMHHGSRHSSYPGLSFELLPRFAVFSYGVDNKFHHPSGSVVMDFQRVAECVAVTEQESASASLTLSWV